ncbi:unnamed protein product [Sphagnum troendelagicum]
MHDSTISWNDDNVVVVYGKKCKIKIVNEWAYNNKVAYLVNAETSGIYLYKTMYLSPNSTSNVYGGSLSPMMTHSDMIKHLFSLVERQTERSAKRSAERSAERGEGQREGQREGQDKMTSHFPKHSATMYVDVSINVVRVNFNSIVDRSIYHCENVKLVSETIIALSKRKRSRHHHLLVAIFCKVHNKRYSIVYCTGFHALAEIGDRYTNLLRLRDNGYLREVQSTIGHAKIEYHIRTYSYMQPI